MSYPYRVSTDSRASHVSKPWILGFLCLLITLLPTYSVPAGPLKSNGSPAKLLGILLFALVVLAFASAHSGRTKSTTGPAAAIFSLYFFVNLLIYGVGMSHRGSDIVIAGHTRAMLSVVANAGIGLYVATRVRRQDRDFLLGFLAVGLTINCVIALLHSQFNIDLRLMFQPPGFVQNVTAGNQVKLTERLGVFRAQGTSSHPIELAVLAAIAIPITSYFARFAASRNNRVLAAIATPVNFIALVASVSRSGIITLLSALLILIWSLPLRVIFSGLVAVLAIIGVTIGVTPKNATALLDTVTNSATDPSVLDRVADYARVSQTLHDNPVFGLGLGGADPSEYGFTDNQWLQQLVVGGFFGLAAITLVTIAGVFGIAASLRMATTPRQHALSYSVGAAVVGIIASSFTFDLFAYQQATFVLFILIGMLWTDFTLADAESPGAATFERGVVPVVSV